MPIGTANKIPSNLSSNPPWPGSNVPVSLIFAFLFKKEIIKSPTCDEKEIINAKNKVLINKFKFEKKTKQITNDKTNDPITPEYVLFGLILEIFFPFKILPKQYPPMSLAIQIDNININKIVFSELLKNKNSHIINEKKTK